MSTMFFKNMQKYAKNYYTKLKYENKSKNTIDSYKNTIGSFIEFIHKETPISSFKDIKPSTLYNYLEYKENSMNKQGELKPSTKKLYITILKSFFLYIENESDELLSFDKLFENIKIKVKKSIPKGLDEKEKIALLNYLEKIKTSRDDFVTFRNSLAIKTVLFSGLRVSEMLSLKYSDYFLLEEDEIYKIVVIGKGEKTRTTYIQKEFIEDEMEELLSYKSPNDFVCLSSNGNVMNRQNLDQMLKSICRGAKITEVGFHALRHTFAKNFLDKGGNITHLQKLLGHSSIETTMLYTNPYEDDIKIGFVKIA